MSACCAYWSARDFDGDYYCRFYFVRDYYTSCVDISPSIALAALRSIIMTISAYPPISNFKFAERTSYYGIWQMVGSGETEEATHAESFCLCPHWLLKPPQAHLLLNEVSRHCCRAPAPIGADSRLPVNAISGLSAEYRAVEASLPVIGLFRFIIILEKARPPIAIEVDVNSILYRAPRHVATRSTSSVCQGTRYRLDFWRRRVYFNTSTTTALKLRVC